MHSARPELDLKERAQKLNQSLQLSRVAQQYTSKGAASR